YEGVKKGGYVISEGEKETPDALLIATGSEVQLAVASQQTLKEKGIDTNVISIPSWDRFNAQDDAYKHEVIPPHVKYRVGIEMGASFGWGRSIGGDGIMLGIDRVGASAEGEKVIEEFGFTVENVVNHVESLLKEAV